MENKTGRSGFWDSIKGIGIIGIIFIHTTQWNPILPATIIGSNIRNAGLLGVEITFLVNAYFYTMSYDKKVRNNGSSILEIVVHKFKRIIPIYWIALTIYLISTVLSENTLGGVSLWNIAAHYLFLNGLTPSLFSTFMGGSGYIGVLSIMWMCFPVFLKRVNSFRESLIYSVLTISISFIVYRLLYFSNGVFFYVPVEIWEPWLWYIYRGGYCYPLGAVLYYLNKESIIGSLKGLEKRVISTSCMLLISIKILELGNSFDGFVFTLLWVFVISANSEKSTIFFDNCFLAYFGRYSMEMFVGHILFEYIVVINGKFLEPGLFVFVLTWIFTIVFAPIFNRMADYLTLVLKKLY